MHAWIGEYIDGWIDGQKEKIKQDRLDQTRIWYNGREEKRRELYGVEQKVEQSRIEKQNRIDRQVKRYKHQEIKRQPDKQIERQTDRQIEREREIERQKDRKIERNMDRQRGRKVGRQIDSGQIDSQIDIEADGQIDRY